MTPRKRSAEPRTVQGLYASDREREAWRQAAGLAGMSFQSWARSVLNRIAKRVRHKAGLDKPPSDVLPSEEP
jgi:hypothetical protein